MRILTVLPITNNQYIEDLSYFSIKDIPLGAIVEAPIKDKYISAIVIDSVDASNIKASIKSSDFALKRIGVAQHKEILPIEFVRTASIIANYYATNIGSVIYSMLPKFISDIDNSTHKNITHKNSLSEVYALQAPLNDRISIYKNTIREAFAKKESVLMVLPTVVSAISIYEHLSTNLRDRVYILNNKTPKSRQAKIFNKIHASTKSVLLISTPKYATLFRSDISTIIIEDESSDAYNTLKRPYINMAKFIETYANLSKLKLIFGGTVLSSKINLELDKGTISELTPKSTRDRNKTKIKILDTRKELGRKENTKKSLKQAEVNCFNPIDNRLRKVIYTTISKEKNVFILAPRRGLAPLTVCRDCKTPVLCSTCNTPITLRTTKTQREFLCYKCGETKDSDTTCSYCNSWRLDTLGIGIELIEKELKKEFKVNITRIDKQTTKTDSQIQSAINRFNSKGGILLGTQLAIPHLHKIPIEISAIASLDSMLSIPNFEIDERIFSLLLQIKNLTNNTLYIQTRLPDKEVLTRAQEGDISRFMREELKLRKELKYPPFTVMIRITATGSKKSIIEQFQNIMPKIKPYKPRIFKQFYQLSPNKFALHALLRIPTNKYPNTELVEILKNIQPTFEVKVNIE